MLSKLFAWFTAPEVFLGDKLRGRTTADMAVKAFMWTEAFCLPARSLGYGEGPGWGLGGYLSVPDTRTAALHRRNGRSEGLRGQMHHRKKCPFKTAFNQIRSDSVTGKNQKVGITTCSITILNLYSVNVNIGVPELVVLNQT